MVSQRPATDKDSRFALGRGSRTLQPRRPGNSQRHRAPALRRPRPPSRNLQAAQTGAGRARRAGTGIGDPMSAGTQPILIPWSPAPAQLHMAYSVCRGITRANAKNFYYAFLVLPKRKRQALCAVYAFMRRCDDIADDAVLSIEERRYKLDVWLDALHRVQQGEPSDDPILLALTDTQRRYTIPAGLLDELAMGTAMDVDPGTRNTENQVAPAAAVPGLTVQYQTFDDLKVYCYRVASVVRLVCIHFFGCRDHG